MYSNTAYHSTARYRYCIVLQVSPIGMGLIGQLEA